MAITQVTNETVDGVVIGLSDTIGNLIQAGEFTIENLTPYMFCGQSTIGNVKYSSLSDDDRTFNGNVSNLPSYFPVTNTGNLGYDTVQFKLSENNTLANASYGRNILIHGTVNNNEPQSIRSDNMSASDMRIVTSIDFTKIYYDVELGAQTLTYDSPAGTSIYYATGQNGAVKTSATNQNTSCYVYSIFGTNDDWYCIKDWLFPCSDSANNNWQFVCNQTMRGNYANTGASLLYGYTNFDNNKTMTRVRSTSNGSLFGTENYDWTQPATLAAISGDVISVMDYLDYAGTSIFYLTGLDNALKQVANAGLKFKYNNTWYKPLGQGGVIYGYTDDMSKTSEWDNITNVTGNTVPTSPPTPDIDDNEIDVNMGQFVPTQCFVNYIELSTEDMIKFANDFNAYNESIWNLGGDLMKNLISYKIFAVYGTHSGTIKNVSIGGHEIEYNNAPVSGNYIDDMGKVDLGSIEIGSKFRFNDWRDYAPYTKIECFVPCCGWCQLPPWCMGRVVTGTLYIDLANGSCKAVIKAGKTPVAEIGGCVAMDVPFSSVATGAKAAGIITAITNGAVAAFNPTPQNLISGSFGILSSLNANYTETKGVMGDGSNINGCTDFLIKVTRPASTDTGNGTITETYKHTKGLPCARSMKLTKGDGFTQISNANITGTMTAREKQMIVDGFRHGLIL